MALTTTTTALNVGTVRQHLEALGAQRCDNDYGDFYCGPADSRISYSFPFPAGNVVVIDADPWTETGMPSDAAAVWSISIIGYASDRVVIELPKGTPWVAAASILTVAGQGAW